MDKSKLVKVLNMMGSSFENERMTALTMAHKLVTESGQTWAQLLKNNSHSGFSMRPDVALTERARKAGFDAGYQAGQQAGHRAAMRDIISQVEAAYKRGVKETMDKSKDAQQVKHLMEQAYEKGRTYERNQIKVEYGAATKASYTAGGAGGGGGSYSSTTTARSAIKWDKFAINALQGKYGATPEWETNFLRSIVHFPHISPKQLAVLQRIANELGFSSTILS